MDKEEEREENSWAKHKLKLFFSYFCCCGSSAKKMIKKAKHAGEDLNEFFDIRRLIYKITRLLWY